jgi:3'(2'), 5'-bisphosphate nucleotidase
MAVVSHSHLDGATEAFLATLNIKARMSAGSSLKLLMVARGEADVYPRLDLEADRSGTARQRQTCGTQALSRGAPQLTN